MYKIKHALKFLFGASFVLAGLNHFLNTDMYMAIMPPYLPWHRELIYVSGIFEIVFGVLLFFRHTNELAAWGLIALLIAVFPANIQMAWHSELYPQFSPAALWLRLPLQVVLIALVYWFTRPKTS
ncbi:MAG: DoxX family protein [Pyrinomonadaceae bacterium]